MALIRLAKLKSSLYFSCMTKQINVTLWYQGRDSCNVSNVLDVILLKGLMYCSWFTRGPRSQVAGEKQFQLMFSLVCDSEPVVPATAVREL